MAGGRHAGGIIRFLDLIGEHRAAFEYDWRNRFPGVPGGLAGVPEHMPWDEAVRVARVLAKDPGSAVGAALAGMDYPTSVEALGVLDLYDLTVRLHTDKQSQFKPHPLRPKVKRAPERVPSLIGRDRARAALLRIGPTGS